MSTSTRAACTWVEAYASSSDRIASCDRLWHDVDRMKLFLMGLAMSLAMAGLSNAARSSPDSFCLLPPRFDVASLEAPEESSPDAFGGSCLDRR